MKTKSLMLLFVAAVLSTGVILFGFVFVNGQVGAVQLTEETLAGSKATADGLTAGYQADAGEELHWTASYDFTSVETTSAFKRGELVLAESRSVYEDFRFTGWSQVPYTTFIEKPSLEGLQAGKVQQFYDGLPTDASGKIRLADYLDYYPVSFRFQFGAKIYNSDDALTGLKIYEDSSDASGKASEYDEDVRLYVDLNRFFQIPVIANEYQNYQMSEGIVKVEPSLDEGEDYYQFDPIIVLQEENLMDGVTWEHPDLAGSETLEKDGNYAGKTADQYNLKNRLLFVVNTRTAKGEKVDVSKIADGYGIYELPVETRATASVRYGKRSTTVPNPKPLSDQLSMVYPLDEDIEYVEMTMSPDHRYLAIFSVRDHGYFVELVDADTWEKEGSFRMFDVAEKMTYTWGEDSSLAVTNFQNEIAVFVRTSSNNDDYRMLYRGDVPEEFDDAFFDAAMTEKAHSHGAYQCGFDEGLAIEYKDGKIAFVQNPMMRDDASGLREPSMTCAVMDETRILYWGMLHSNVRDSGNAADGKSEEQRITPIANENWVRWE